MVEALTGRRSVRRGAGVLVFSLVLVGVLRFVGTRPGCQATNANPWGCTGQEALVAAVGLLVLVAITTWVWRDLGVGWALLGAMVSLVVSLRCTSVLLVGALEAPDNEVVILLRLSVYAVVFAGLTMLWDVIVRRSRAR